MDLFVLLVVSNSFLWTCDLLLLKLLLLVIVKMTIKNDFFKTGENPSVTE